MTTLKMRPEILTSAGHYFNFMTPENSVFSIDTIAHALSHICRFNGHTRTHYSVAQHSVMVSWQLPPEHALAGLLHDAAEAFIGDVASPLKQLLPDYKVIEQRVEAEIFKRFGLPADLHAAVVHADRVMLATEARDLMPCHADDWGFPPALACTVTPWTSDEACDLFLLEFEKLMRQ